MLNWGCWVTFMQLSLASELSSDRRGRRWSRADPSCNSFAPKLESVLHDQGNSLQSCLWHWSQLLSLHRETQPNQDSHTQQHDAEESTTCACMYCVEVTCNMARHWHEPNGRFTYHYYKLWYEKWGINQLHTRNFSPTKANSAYKSNFHCDYNCISEYMILHVSHRH